MVTRQPPWNDAALNASWRRAEHERAYWEAHAADLTTQYPDQFVAVLDDQVVAHDPDLVALWGRLRTDGHEITECWLRFLPGPDTRYLL